ncbi:MAG: sugar phosphate nucleotidyltransferase [Burkholderiales bacterium]
MKILALVMAGGEGSRLHPLTADRAKPAISFAGRYRIVDFVLSNLVNSGITSIYVLAQYKPQSLIEHIRAAWAPALRGPGRFVSVVLPGADLARGPFLGTADAVRKNLHLCARHAPDLVAVFAADHVYRMDVGQMVEAHVQSKADVSVAAVPVPVERASPFGIIAAHADGRIHEFQEKPERPAPIPQRPSHAYASMGNYLFDPGVLAELLDKTARPGETDFGRHILPRAMATHRVFAYDFACNRVPGILPHEERNYWRDVGTIEAYRAAQRDASGPRPKFSLANGRWPIGGGSRGRVAERTATLH